MKRYAGFDSDEDNFDGVELAPLHEQDEPKPRQPLTRIDTARAWHLKGLGRSWAEVGRLMAIEEGRNVPYTANGIRFAAHSVRAVKQ